MYVLDKGDFEGGEMMLEKSWKIKEVYVKFVCLC